MKYGEILDIRTKDKAVVGKEYVFSDILYNLINSPQNCAVNILGRVKKDASLPFEISCKLGFQFIREVIEEEPKYRPYRDTDELKADFFKDCPRMDKRHRPAIWVVTKFGSEYEIGGFSNDGQHVLIHCAGTYTMKELFENFNFLDGSPCGIKEE